MGKTSYTIKTDPKYELWFSDCTLWNLFNSYFIRGVSTTKKVYLDEYFRIQEINTKLKLDGFYFLTTKQNEIVLNKYIYEKDEPKETYEIPDTNGTRYIIYLEKSKEESPEYDYIICVKKIEK